ncbi:chorion class CB protein M5H4-like [Pararge aegeria]|uniref:Jg17024 protein n=2 Tax=Pararge aegeria TaxID=116150 RepID=A0A8S4R5C7_9NEOP|nr:chorion class CB protein M5H4-like [Pararge aegeria]CAH2229275.1 jg17024 [Pararge aegeria aegeria]
MGLKIACLLFSAVTIQTIVGQCLRAPYPAAYPNDITIANLGADLPLAYPVAGPFNAGPGVPGLTYGLSLAELSASNGEGLRVNSASPIAATGVTVETDKMVIEGPLAVTGQLPFLGAVALEGPLPASGMGAVAYECGNGQIGIVNEGVEPAPVLAPTYPNGQIATGYQNGPMAAYPNMQLGSGYPNAGLIPFANNFAPGYGPISRV